MGKTLSIDNNIQPEDLRSKLKETTSLSEQQIKEVVDAILGSVSEIKKLETDKAKSSTQKSLLEMKQTIELETNGIVTYNGITNNFISITINENLETTQRQPRQTTQRQSQQTTQRQSQQTTQRQPQQTAQRQSQQTTQRQPQQTTQRQSQQTTQRQSQQITQRQPQQTEQRQLQQTTQRQPQQTTQRETQRTIQRQSQQPQQRQPQQPVQREIQQSTIQNQPIIQQEMHSSRIDNEQHMNTPEGLLLKLEQLLAEIKRIEKGISKKSVGSTGREGIDSAKAKLKQYKQKIEGRRKALKKNIKKGTAQVSKLDVDQVKTIESDIEKVKVDLNHYQWNESSNESRFLLNSPENISTASEYERERLYFNRIMEEELKDLAVLSIFNRNVEEAKNFYRRIAEGRGTCSQEDYQFFVAHSAILTPSFQRCGIVIPTYSVVASTTRLNEGGSISNPRSGNGGSTEVVSSTPRVQSNYDEMDWGETFKVGGVAGLLDKLLSSCGNMTPGQRETWKTLGVLGCVAGGIYGLYKFYTSDKISLWGKAGITAGTIFTSQFLTGEGPISLISKVITGGLSMDELKDKFGTAVTGLGTSSGSTGTTEVAQGSTRVSGGSLSETGVAQGTVRVSGESLSETVVPAMYSLMIFNTSTKVSDIRAMTKTFNDNNENRRIFYNKSCDKLRKEYNNGVADYFSSIFSDKYDETKWKNWLASFGVTDATSQTESVYGLSNNATMNETILEKFKTDYGVEVTDKKALDDYKKEKKDTNRAIDVDDLKSHIDNNGNGWFKVRGDAINTQREEDIQNKESLVSQVDLLSIDDAQKKELKQAVQDFYDGRTVNTKPKIRDFSLKMERGYLILTSHNGERARIDLNKKELVGFCTFTNLADLLNVADISNKVLDTQKGKIPKDMPPFQYKIERKGICFNDATSLRQDIVTRNNSGMDTRVLSTGWRGATRKIEELYKRPNEFAKYLSDRWMDAKKINLDSYPLTKQLSNAGGLVFTDINEVKNVENLLETIKIQIGPIYSNQPKPFDIGYKISNPTKRYTLTFTRLKGKTLTVEIEDFEKKYPTIIENKEKFLSFLNNPSNGMFKKQS